ncbi:MULTISPECIES: M28 family peptidase [Caldisericum]|jgi:endoglucanase|uniref:M28 family peptidase n=1 Tax=Caldisericum TaxID=693074 RepID=UPI003C780B16
MDESLLRNLTESFAPTGNEKIIFPIIESALKGYVDEIKIHERSNSLMALKKGNGNFALMLEAHVDEVFMVVSSIEKNGFLKVTSRSIDPKILPGSQVIVHGKKKIKGVIGIKPYHLVKEGEENLAYDFNRLFVDTGLSENELKDLVSVGDYVSFAPSFDKIGNYLVNKSFDNRLGVYVLIETARVLKNIKHDVNVYFLFSSQEEYTGLGAITATFSVFPNASVVLDVTFGTQYKVTPFDGFELGKGPTIFYGISVNRELTNKLASVADKYGIPYQKEVGVLSSTDADKVGLVRSGIPTSLLSIPIRYMHTPVEMFDPFDVDKTVQLLKLFIGEFEPTEDRNGEY